MEDQQDPQTPGVLADNGKIDMSLDDIIKLQNAETVAKPKGNQRNKARNGNFQNKGFFRGTQRNQGAGRQRFGLKRGYSGKANNQDGPVTRRRAASMKGVSPLDRQHLNKQSSVNTAQSLISEGRQPQKKNFRQAAVSGRVLTARNKAQNRRPQYNQVQRQQRSNAVNQNRRLTQHMTLNSGKRQPNARWQTDKRFGSTLTVSVPNPKASHSKTYNKLGMKRPGLRFRKPIDQSPLPKGVPLRFNYRATVNHTNVTLNDRFSSLQIKGQFSPSRSRGRTVLLV
ncbi:UAP56-interacting factor-like [Spea bombifrons]|uniref:UAP56-interacting factor-like n=1 Tax=Spea bombifrons TaxID=233779 RepID=UPI00234B5308|nr:UAP56-interacting factor-like [Spea bombifrons]